MLGLHLLFQSSNPDFKKLIQVGADDAEELEPLQQWIFLIESLIEHTLVKLQPAQSAINEKRGIIKFHGHSIVRRIYFRSRGEL